MAQWRTSRGGQYDRDRVRNRPALHERHGRSGARFVRAIPDSCWNFPIGARHSRFVLKFPDSCARFPIEVMGRLPSGAIRSTPWGESLHPPASPGANRSSVWSIFPDWCSNFPIGAFWSIGTELAYSVGHEPIREVGCHEPQGPRGRPFAGVFRKQRAEQKHFQPIDALPVRKPSKSRQRVFGSARVLLSATACSLPPLPTP